jgi:hypothetical protein
LSNGLTSGKTTHANIVGSSADSRHDESAEPKPIRHAPQAKPFQRFANLDQRRGSCVETALPGHPGFDSVLQ